MLEAWLAGHNGAPGGVLGGGVGGFGGGGRRSSSGSTFGGRDLRRYLSLSRMEEAFLEETSISGFVSLRRRGVDTPKRKRPLRPTSLPVVSTTDLISQKESSSPPPPPPIPPLPMDPSEPEPQDSSSSSASSQLLHPLISHWKCEVSSFYQMRMLQLSDGRTPNGEGGGNNPEGRVRGNNKPEGDDDEEELGAFWELLDSELRPIQPVRTCPESLSIFSEHKEMARRYLVLQQEIFNLRKHKSILEEKLSQAEKLEHLGNQRYQDKIRELENKRENLRHTHTKLRQQLEQIRLRQEEQQLQQNHQEDGSGNGIGHNHPLSPP